MTSNQHSYLTASSRISYNSTASRTESRPKMNYDDVLEELGELGAWQILHLFLLWLPATAAGIYVLTYSFTGINSNILAF